MGKLDTGSILMRIYLDQTTLGYLRIHILLLILKKLTYIEMLSFMDVKMLHTGLLTARLRNVPVFGGFCGTCGSADMGNMTQMHLIDGTIIIPLVRKTKITQQVEIDVDTNGYKGPNVWGKDVFRLFLSSYTDYKLLGAPSNYSRMSNLNTCKNNVYKNIYGCAAVIMADGWEIKDDYPW